MSLTNRDPQPLTQAPPEEVQRAQAERLLRAWKVPEGWRYWSEVNNTEVGLWYTAVVFLFFLFGGVLALSASAARRARQHLALCRLLQPGIHAARLGDDVSVRPADL